MGQKGPQSVIKKVKLDGVDDVATSRPHVVKEIILAAFALNKRHGPLVFGLLKVRVFFLQQVLEHSKMIARGSEKGDAAIRYRRTGNK